MKYRSITILTILLALFLVACGGATPEPTPAPAEEVEEVMDEEAMDEEAMDEEAMDEEAMDEEAIDEEAMDEEAMDEEAMDEEAMDEETMEESMDEEMDHSEDAMDEEVMEEPTMSIAEIAVADGSFTTLVAALDAAGLVETLSGEGAFTVFAPTDEAFAALAEGTVDALLEDPDGALTDILLYHVIDGAVKAETVVTLESATALNGAVIAIDATDGVVLNESVNVVATDIVATNGVIHVIDAVLLPPAEEAMEEEAMMEEDAMMEEPTMSITEIAVADGSFTTLVAALDAAGLVETLSGEGAFTVFAPTDEAFAALPEGTVDALLEDPDGALTDILLYHVIDGAVKAETVVTLESATTLNGADVAIDASDGVVLNESVNVVVTDIVATNGVIHVIDAVLLPPAEEAMEEEAMVELITIAEIAAGSEDFETLTAALTAANLVDTLSGEGPFTVFAPTDDAFAALPEGTVEALLEDPEGALTDILLYHVVAGAVNAETVVTLDSATTVNGADVTIAIDDDGNVVLNDTVMVVVTDVEASNGLIHVIDAVLLPPSGE